MDALSLDEACLDRAIEQCRETNERFSRPPYRRYGEAENNVKWANLIAFRDKSLAQKARERETYRYAVEHCDYSGSFVDWVGLPVVVRNEYATQGTMK